MHGGLRSNDGGGGGAAVADGGKELGSVQVTMLANQNMQGDTYVNVYGLAKVVTVADRPVIVYFDSVIQSFDLGGKQSPEFQLFRDNDLLVTFRMDTITANTDYQTINRIWRDAPPPGDYNYHVMARTGSGQSARFPINSWHTLRITEV